MAESIETGTNQLLFSIREGVAVITLNRPEARNALSDEIRHALAAAIKRSLDDHEVGALLLTGSGNSFCSGGDVKGMGDKRPQTDLSAAEKAKILQQRQRPITGALVHSPKPTIAALPGPAAGGGLALALACDMRIAAASAFVSTSYAKIALTGDYGIAWLLIRAIGDARARELMMTAERVDAARAERIGLINRVVPDAELPSQAFALAQALANGPRPALRSIKANLNEAREQDYLSALDAEALRVAEAGQTEDHKEAVRAFVEKRAPRFRDRI